MKKFTLLLLFTVMGILNANAQWTADTAVNTLVASSTPFDPQSIGTSTGKTYAVFWKQIEAPVNFELHVQLLDANGIKQFGEDGILVSNTIPMTSYTMTWNLTVDKNDNLFVAVNGTTSTNPGFVFKITPAGELPWANPISLGTTLFPKVISLSNGDILVSYNPGGGKGKLQRYNTEGVAVWTTPVDINPNTENATRSTFAADMYEHPNGDFTIVFNTKLSYGTAAYFFAQRYTAAGVALWTSPVQLANMQSAYNIPYNGTVDGDVVYYSYSLSHDSRFDSYVQRINPDGTLPWGINGKDFDTNQTYFEKDTKIAYSEGSDYIWAISVYTGTAQGSAGEYVQKFDKITGARLFTDNAKQVFAVNEDFKFHDSNLYLLNDKPLFISQSGFDNGITPITLNAVFLDENGNFILPNQTLPVATFSGAKSNISLQQPVENTAVVVFAEAKTDGGEKKIYAQRFSTATNCTVTPDAIADYTSQCSVTLADLSAPTTTDSCGNAITATTDNSVFPINQGTTVITWTYTTAGATAIQTQNIIVNDTTAPTLVVQNIAVTVAEDATVVLTPAQFDNGSTDSCGNATSTWTWAVAPASFTCADLGEQTVTITATDANGNIATATATVTITDPNNYCNTAGVAEFDKNVITLYPNPANDIFSISSPNAIKLIVVYDMLGKIIFSSAGLSPNPTVDVKSWSAGVYHVNTMDTNGNQQRFKLVKN